jgi:predicted RNA methylase
MVSKSLSRVGRRLLRAVRKIAGLLRTEGPIEVFRIAYRRALTKARPDPFDLQNAVDTSGHLSLFKLDISSAHESVGFSYSPSPAEVCEKLFASLAIRHQDFTFIDLGAGKGRVLLVASRFPFKRLIGVEFARELVETARLNIQKFGCRAEIVHADAAEYRFPSENLVVYLYNPFGPEVLRPVLRSLREISISREVYLLYLNPKNSSCVEEVANEIDQIAGAKVYYFERPGNRTEGAATSGA